MKSPRLLIVCAAGWLLNLNAFGADWPQFRYDAGRTAACHDELPADLQLLWTRTLPPPRPAYPNELRLAYDASYEPVVMGETMFVPSMVNDSLTALDTETGAVRWRFMTGGPVRFAPAAWSNRVCLVSDDGYLYCLNAQDGSLLWKFRGLPEDRQDRQVMGNGRLISLWPARGGPVIADGVVYFAAGLWPTEGVFIHALHVASGDVVWSNTDSHLIPESNWDHGIGHVAGLMPQGYLAIIDDKLVVPCGTQLPAFLDLGTGERQTYTMGWGGRLGLPKGCWFVAGTGRYLSHAGDLYDITRPSGERLQKAKPGRNDYKSMLYPGGWTRLVIEQANQRELDWFSQPVITPEVMYESDRNVVAWDLGAYTMQKWTEENRPAHRLKDEIPDSFGATFKKRWELPLKRDVHIKAGNRLYVGGSCVVEALDLAKETPEVVWQVDIEGTPSRMLAAARKLFVVTGEGQIFAYGKPATGDPLLHAPSETAPPARDRWTARVETLLEATGVREGYALVWSSNSGRLIEELVRQSDLHVIAVDKDALEVAALRERLHRAGLYGTRASVHVGDPVAYPFPPHLAHLIVMDDPADHSTPAQHQAQVRAAFRALHPYGGVACVGNQPDVRPHIEEMVKHATLPGAHIRQTGDLLLLTRSGALPGAADWSHGEANAASSGASTDDLRAPSSVLWFDAAQRWHKFPGQNQVRISGGRLLLLEENRLQASDVYTGRRLWTVDLPEIAQSRQTTSYTLHRQWGPQTSLPPTTQFVAMPDAIYLGRGSGCQVFDPATGRTRGRMDIPGHPKAAWENLRVSKDYLVGSRGHQVLCLDRQTGREIWRHETIQGGLYLALGTDKVFGFEPPGKSPGRNGMRDGRLFALDLATGAPRWEQAGGGRLRYSQALDIVVTPEGFYKGADGERLSWPAHATGQQLVIHGTGLPKSGVPGFIAGGQLLTGSSDSLRVYDLQSAEPVGNILEWNRRGCTGTRASTHLLTVRYRGNAAWIDLDSRQITPILGIRPGCSINNNLYPANGVLNMPNLTAGCTCNYLPVSMALVPREAVAHP